jgi:hypothetical protein
MQPYFVTEALRTNLYDMKYIVTNLINALPDSSSVNTAQDATIEEVVFSVFAVTSQQWIVVT